MKYVIKDFEDVFRAEFIEWLRDASGGFFTKVHMQQVINEVSKFEKREGLEFVCFQEQHQLIIFREL